jgi:hypothetical protein
VIAGVSAIAETHLRRANVSATGRCTENARTG